MANTIQQKIILVIYRTRYYSSDEDSEAYVGRTCRLLGMSDSEMSKRIMNYNPKRTRRAERSNERWTDAVDNDTKKSDVIDWRIYAKDTDGWRRIL
jgi:hypothetical protein